MSNNGVIGWMVSNLYRCSHFNYINLITRSPTLKFYQIPTERTHVHIQKRFRSTTNTNRSINTNQSSNTSQSRNKNQLKETGVKQKDDSTTIPHKKLMPHANSHHANRSQWGRSQWGQLALKRTISVRGRVEALQDLSADKLFLRIARARAKLSEGAVRSAVEKLSIVVPNKKVLNKLMNNLSIVFAKRKPTTVQKNRFYTVMETKALNNIADILSEYKDNVMRNEETVFNADVAKMFQQPHLWFPEARLLTRNIHVHMGPTNSGKTHTALQALRKAKSGCFAGPLRLLAWEVHDALNYNYAKDPLGIIPCNLLTGQEKVTFDGAMHTSSTVEMIDTKTHIEVGVIDEIQMIGDEERGWAWTRAVLGIPADELHLCGDHTALDLVKRLVNMTGDNLIVHEYKRLSELKVVDQDEVLRSYENVRDRDCVVSFGLKALHAAKEKIEESTNFKCSVVYGGLPPENRRSQAELFNNKETQILCATDAVGMGLNLHIGRIVFDTVQKFDGIEKRPLKATEIKQIGGRAGRYSSDIPVGYVATLKVADYPFLKRKMDESLLQIKRGGLIPTPEIVEYVQEIRPDLSLDDIISNVEVMPYSKDNMYFMCNLDNAKHIAKLLKPIPSTKLPITERWEICSCPATINDPICSAHLLMYVTQSRDLSVVHYPADDLLPVEQSAIPSEHDMIVDVSNLHNRLDLYLWFNNKYGDYFFPDVERVTEARIICTQLIEAGLYSMSKQRSSNHEDMPGVARPSWLPPLMKTDVSADDSSSGNRQPSQKNTKVAFEFVQARLDKFVRGRCPEATPVNDAEVGDVVHSKFF